MLRAVRLARRTPLHLRRLPVVVAARATQRRCNTTIAQEQQVSGTQEGMVFINSVFPTRLSSWDFRHYIGILLQEELLDKLNALLDKVHKHEFKVLAVEPRGKDGGVFVRFNYSLPSSSDRDTAIQEIVDALQQEAKTRGGVPSWAGMASIWPVKGVPWREDLHRYASQIIKVSFDGPDVREEDLYSIFRPFGKIHEILPPTPVPAGNLRSSQILYRNLRSSVTAHNCVHGLSVPSGPSGTKTKLITMYERPIKPHVVRDWIAGHPRIVLPIVVFLLGSLTYTIFDPIRAFMVEGKLLGWFDYKSSSWFRWIKENTIQKFSFTLNGVTEDSTTTGANIWAEREVAERDVKGYLSDFPNTVTFVHGPQGSGKSRMLRSVLKEVERPVLTIDCAELYSAGSDAAVLRSLSRQMGYKPVFPFVNSFNNLIDIASMGLIGQKAGLSTSLTEQVKEMLQTVGTALGNASKRRRKEDEHKIQEAELDEQHRIDRARQQALVRYGTWHDGRLDCVAGNGVMSELGVGDERMRPEDFDIDPASLEIAEEIAERSVELTEKKQKTSSELQAIQTMPVVIIKNFATKRGRDDVIAVMSTWAASLVDNNVAHVIVLSDNRENAKQLAQALPSKPLHAVALSDADSSSALSFVQTKLKTDQDFSFTNEQMKAIGKLGGRASDLETLVHKVRSGQAVQEAVEDIIGRSTNELRKNAFGEDAEDEKSLPWTRIQAWHVIKLLSKKDEVSYHDLLLEFPFKDNETSLRNMEHAELITIVTQNGRPSAIKPGKPVYHYVFQRLVEDPVFRALQDITFNEKKISSAEATVRSCEDELLKLKEIGTTGTHWWSKKPATAYRAAYVMRKMVVAEGTIEKLESTNADLKKLLAKCE